MVGIGIEDPEEAADVMNGSAVITAGAGQQRISRWTSERVAYRLLAFVGVGTFVGLVLALLID